MKKIFTALSGIVLAFAIFFQGSAFTSTAMAADTAAYSVKQS